eukprot:9636346-Heterocapsa_arctica.AAC.1
MTIPPTNRARSPERAPHEQGGRSYRPHCECGLSDKKGVRYGEIVTTTQNYAKAPSSSNSSSSSS